MSKFHPFITILKKMTLKIRKLPQIGQKMKISKEKKVPLDNLEIHSGFKFDPDRLKNYALYIDGQTTDILIPYVVFFLHFLHRLIWVLYTTGFALDKPNPPLPSPSLLLLSVYLLASFKVSLPPPPTPTPLHHAGYLFVNIAWPCVTYTLTNPSFTKSQDKT